LKRGGKNVFKNFTTKMFFFLFIMKRVPQYTNTPHVGDLQDAVLACATPHSFERGLAEVSGTTA
jgi:hypothetical protein